MTDVLNLPEGNFPAEYAPNSLLEGSTSDFNLIAGSSDVNLMNCKGCSSINSKNFTMFNRNDAHIIGSPIDLGSLDWDRQRFGDTIWTFNDFNDLSSVPFNLEDYDSFFHIEGQSFIEIDVDINSSKYLNFTFWYVNDRVLGSDASVVFYGIDGLGASDTIEEIIKFNIPSRPSEDDYGFKTFSRCLGSSYRFIRIQINSSSLSYFGGGLYIYKQFFELTYLKKDVNPIYSKFNSGGEEDFYYISDQSCYFVADSGLFVEGDVSAFSSSDIRLKNNVKALCLSIEDIKKIKPVKFEWNNKQKTYKGIDIGFLAQDVEGILSQLVVSRNDGFKAIDYKKSVVIGVEGVKQINKTIQRIRSKIKNVK